MLTIRRLSAFLGLVLFFGCASASEQIFNDGTWIEYSAAGDPVRFTDTSGKVFTSRLSETVSSFEKTALPPLIAAQDFWSVSKVYFQLAIVRSRLNETHAACVALSQSLEYYRAALVKDKLSVAYFGEMASDGSDDGDGMQVVRSKLGCGSNLAAWSR